MLDWSFFSGFRLFYMLDWSFLVVSAHLINVQKVKNKLNFSTRKNTLLPKEVTLQRDQRHKNRDRENRGVASAQAMILNGRERN